MESLARLREIKKEVLQMDFNYKNVHRIMYLLHETKTLFEGKYPIPNKDIAYNQTKKIIANELMKLLKANSEDDIRNAFNDVVENFKLVMAYIS